MINNLTQLILVSRPISWPNTAYPFAAAYLLMGGVVDVIFIIGTLFFLIPYNLLLYGVNDVYDYESDLRNPRKGGIEGAMADKQFHRVILGSAYALALSSALLLVALTDWKSSAVLVGVLFFVLAYSVPVLRFKERPILDSITSSIHFVGPMVYALMLTSFPTAAWPFTVAFFLWGMASHAFGAVQDINADLSGGIGSIATVLGARTTVWFAFVLYLLSSAILVLTGTYGATVGAAGLVYALNIAPYLRLTDDTAERSNTAWRRFIYLNLFTGFIVTLVLIYSIMVS